jgi:hypothetical protein
MTGRFAVALALASLCACAGSYTGGSTPLNPIDGGGQGVTVDGGGDAGTDGGVDGGADAGPDAGCEPLSLNGVGAIDSCAPSPQTGTASVSVGDAGQGCPVSITLTTPSMLSCSGVASGGTVDAFSGNCGAMQCASMSLPGTIFCSGSNGLCQIQICDDAGTCP